MHLSRTNPVLGKSSFGFKRHDARSTYIVCVIVMSCAKNPCIYIPPNVVCITSVFPWFLIRCYRARRSIQIDVVLLFGHVLHDELGA